MLGTVANITPNNVLKSYSNKEEIVFFISCVKQHFHRLNIGLPCQFDKFKSQYKELIKSGSISKAGLSEFVSVQ